MVPFQRGPWHWDFDNSQILTSAGTRSTSMSLNRENGSGHHYLISACNEASISPYIAMGPSLDLPGTDRGQPSSSQTTPRLNTRNIDTSFLPSVSNSRTQTLSCSMPRRDQSLSPPASPLLKQSDAILRGTQLSRSSESHLLFPEPSSATSPPSTPRRDGSRTPRPHHHAELLSALNSPNISDLTKMSAWVSEFLKASSHSDVSSQVLNQDRRFYRVPFRL